MKTLFKTLLKTLAVGGVVCVALFVIGFFTSVVKVSNTVWVLIVLTTLVVSGKLIIKIVAAGWKSDGAVVANGCGLDSENNWWKKCTSDNILDDRIHDPMYSYLPQNIYYIDDKDPYDD